MVNACSAPRFMLPTASPAFNFLSAFLCCRRQAITVDTGFFAPSFHAQMAPAILWFETEVSMLISTSPNRTPEVTSFCRTRCLWSSAMLYSHADCRAHSYSAAMCALISLNLSLVFPNMSATALTLKWWYTRPHPASEVPSLHKKTNIQFQFV